MIDHPSLPVVLVVEDEWLLRMELADALTAEGWIVVESGSGEDALARLGRAEQFDLLVTDIRLGGHALGWDVAVEWRKRGSRTPVIYVSANDPKDSRRVAESIFLSKPVVLPTFIASCRQLVGHPQS